MSLKLNTKILLFIVLLLVITLSNYLLFLFATKNASTHEKWVFHTYEVITTAERFLGYLRDAETGQRGFLLTGNEEYLEPYHNAIKAAQTDFIYFKKLTKDNPQQQIRLNKVSVLMQQKLSELEVTINLFKQSHQKEALRIVNQGVGKLLMDKMRGYFDNIIQEGSIGQISSIFFSSARNDIVVAKSSNISFILKSIYSSSSFPASILEKSRISLMSPKRELALFLIVRAR